jgi:PAS domain S-box-containing protein
MRKILAIDDNKDNLVTISALLNNLLDDCEVITALSGKEGIEKAKSEQPDTIILDIKMPEMDGFEACRILKNDDTTGHIPIILLTAIKTDVDSRITGLELGADAFLTKPIDETELIAQVKVMLRIKKTEDLLRKEKDLLEEMVDERTHELLESQADLIKERDFVNSLNDASPAFYVAVNEDGEVVTMGKAMVNATGYSFNELKGKKFIAGLVAEKDKDRAEKLVRMMVKNNDESPIELTLNTKDGSEILVEWHGRPMYSKNGKLDYIFFVGIDITERKRLEKIILNDNEMERNKIGQNLHDGLGQHLAGIIFKCDILKMKLEEKDRDEAGDTEEIIAMVSDAIDQTRELARGLCPVDRQAGGLIAALEELCANAEERHSVNCIFKKEGDVTFSGAIESSHLYYIAREAVNNAVKHGKAKNIIIKLKNQNHTFTLEITDDGSGFDKGAHNGQGTGLSIMQYRAWLAGGALSINSNTGGGTVISCMVSSTTSLAGEEAPQKLNRVYEASKDKNKYGIVVVDDHPIVRQGLVQIINREEDLYVCGEARNADEAIKLVSQLKPHLVTVDVSLDGTSGIDLIKALRSRYPGLYHLVLSIYDEALYAERAISVGARGYVMKQEAPFTIIKAIRTVLDGKQYFSENVKEKFINRFQYEKLNNRNISIESLTNREFEVFQYIGQGMGNRHIADKLKISVKTVENYRERIKNKLNIGSSADVVQFAVQWMLNHSRGEVNH